MGADVQEEDFAGNSMSKVFRQSHFTDEESKMVASRNGLFDRGVNGGVVVPVEAARVLSKVDSLGDANFDSRPVGFAIQSGLVDVGAISRFVKKESVVKGGILISSLDLAPFSPCSSFGYLREANVIVCKGV